MKLQVQFTVELNGCASVDEARQRWADVLSGLDRLMEESQDVIRPKLARDIDDVVVALYQGTLRVESADQPTSCGALHPSQRSGV